MTAKQTMVAEIGEAELLLPAQIAHSLAANDEIKYYLALLQTARANADHPQVPAPDLKGERLASRIADESLDDVVGGAVKGRGREYRIPHAAEVLRRIKAAAQTMLACLPDDERAPFAERLKRVKLPTCEHGIVAGDDIDTMTTGTRGAGDSLHILVMDAHRAINRLQAATAPEILAGAHIHGLSQSSRRLVQAFMDGLNGTAPLKFVHPGLGTTAIEHAGRLLIENDIGTTDAHVLVVRVDDNAAILTYSDIHRQRLAFFKSLFSTFDVAWEDADPRKSDKFESGSYLLTTGTYRATDRSDLERYLRHLGSRIVFLIDWNRARKRLGGFVRNEKAVSILKWAADNNFGHRGLLEIGGERALAEAVEYAAGEQLRYGDRLDELIGEANAGAFISGAMRCASTGLRAGRSRRMILDEIKADLGRYFENSGLAVFDIAASHAACGYDLAAAMREAFEYIGTAGGNDLVKRFASRAVRWEARADQLLNEARDDVKRFRRPVSLLRFLESADDAVDELEEAASVLELLAVIPHRNAPMSDLCRLADIALACSQELVKSIECAGSISRSDVRDDLDDFLQALERLIALEHQADEQVRQIRRRILSDFDDARSIYLLLHLAQALEASTDAYAHAGQALRGYLMEEVIG